LIYERPDLDGPLRQGEIFTGLRRAKLDLSAIEREVIQVNFEDFPFAILLEQDCDLEQHHRASLNQIAPDKLLPDFSFLPAVPFETFRGALARDILKRIVANKDERYHVIEQVPVEQDTAGQGLPALGVDFKRHFSMPAGEVSLRLRDRSAVRRSRLATPWAEHLSTRRAYFAARVGLPRDHDVRP